MGQTVGAGRGPQGLPQSAGPSPGRWLAARVRRCPARQPVSDKANRLAGPQPNGSAGRPRIVRCVGVTWRRPGRLAPVLGGLAVLGAGLLMLAGCGRGAAFAVASSRSASSHPSSPSALSPPSPGSPAHARQVQTGPDIQQWQEADTTITSLWMDLEAGMIVQVTGDSLDRDPIRVKSRSASSARPAEAATSAGTGAETIGPPESSARSR